MQVFLKPGHPIPPIATNWEGYCEPWCLEWATPYIARIQLFKFIAGSTVITREIVELDKN